MDTSSVARGAIAVVLGVVIGFGLGATGLEVGLPAQVAVGAMGVVGVGVLAYLYTRDSVPIALRDGAYGLGVTIALLGIGSNLGEPGFLLRVVLFVVVGAVVAGLGYAIDYRWVASGATGRRLPDVTLPDNRVTAWIQGWKWAVVLAGSLLGALARVADGYSLAWAAGEFVRLVFILTVYVFLATALWRGMRAGVRRVRGRRTETGTTPSE